MVVRLWIVDSLMDLNVCDLDLFLTCNISSLIQFIGLVVRTFYMQSRVRTWITAFFPSRMRVSFKMCWSLGQ